MAGIHSGGQGPGGFWSGRTRFRDRSLHCGRDDNGPRGANEATPAFRSRLLPEGRGKGCGPAAAAAGGALSGSGCGLTSKSAVPQSQNRIRPEGWHQKKYPFHMR